MVKDETIGETIINAAQHFLLDNLPDILEVFSDPSKAGEFLDNVGSLLHAKGLPYTGDSKWTISAELQRVADKYPGGIGALVDALGIETPTQSSVQRELKSAAPFIKHGDKGNPAQTVDQYRKAFRRKSGESAKAASKRMEARIVSLLSTGKLKEG